MRTHYEVDRPVIAEKVEEKKEEPQDPLAKAIEAGANKMLDSLNSAFNNPKWKMEAETPKIDEEQIKGEFDGELKDMNKLLEDVDQKKLIKDMGVWRLYFFIFKQKG